MKETYDAKNQVLTIKYEDFMNTETKLPMSPQAYERIKKIEANVNIKLADIDLTSYKLNKKSRVA